MANAQVIPDSQNLNCSIAADNYFKLNPKVPITGANFDLTAYVTSAALTLVQSNGLLPGFAPAPFTIALSNEGTTGCNLTITAANLIAFVVAMNGINAATQFTGVLFATDSGGDSVEVWRGNLSIVGNTAEWNNAS